MRRHTLIVGMKTGRELRFKCSHWQVRKRHIEGEPSKVTALTINDAKPEVGFIALDQIESVVGE